MKKGSIIAINRSQGTTISCTKGDIWLTEPGSKDILLKKGDIYTITGREKTVIKAISHCSFEFL